MARTVDRTHRRQTRRAAQVLRAAARRTAMVCAAGLGAAAIALLGRAAVQAPFLHIRHIHLHGGGSLEALEPVLAPAGIRAGASIVTARPGRAAELLLQHDPWIAAATIRRRLPDRIDIELTMRTPVAVARMDKLYLIDSRGTLFSTIAEHDQRLPLIVGLQREDFHTNPSESLELLGAALRLIENLKHHALASRDMTIVVDGALGLSIVTGAGGVKVRMGFSPFDRKAAALKHIARDLTARQLTASVIDLSSGNRAFVTVGT
jgi:cell division protein FtsQ